MLLEGSAKKRGVRDSLVWEGPLGQRPARLLLLHRAQAVAGSAWRTWQPQPAGGAPLPHTLLWKLALCKLVAGRLRGPGPDT